MDFLTAHQILWALRPTYPLTSSQADYFIRLLALAAERLTLPDLYLVLTEQDAGELALALDQSERSLRRFRTDLVKAGWLGKGRTAEELKFILHEKTVTMSTRVAPRLLAAPTAQPQLLAPVQPAATTPVPASKPSVLVPAVPVVVVPLEPLEEAILSPATPLPVKARRAKPAAPSEVSLRVVKGSGVSLSYAESMACATEAQCLDVEEVEDWLARNAPSVLRIKGQLTPHQLTHLYGKHDAPLLAYILRQLGNKSNKKYETVYFTVDNWCNMQQARQGGADVVRLASVNDEDPLPANLRELQNQAAAAAAQVTTHYTTGDLFTPAPAAELALSPEYEQIRQRQLERSRQFGWDQPAATANAS